MVSTIFHRECLALLEEIVDNTATKIVITSSWRNKDLKYMREIFSLRGFRYPDAIIGETVRGYEYVKKGAHLPIPRGLKFHRIIGLV